MSKTAKEYLESKKFIWPFTQNLHDVVYTKDAIEYGDLCREEERERLNLVIEHIREQIAGLYDTGGICFECKKRDTKECDEKGVCELIFRLFDNDAIEQAKEVLSDE